MVLEVSSVVFNLLKKLSQHFYISSFEEQFMRNYITPIYKSKCKHNFLGAESETYVTCINLPLDAFGLRPLYFSLRPSQAFVISRLLFVEGGTCHP